MKNASVIGDAFQGDEWVFVPGKLRPCLVASSDRDCREPLFKKVVTLPIESYNNRAVEVEIKAALRPHNYHLDLARNFGLHEGYIDFSTPLGTPKKLFDLPFVNPICRMNAELIDHFIDHYAAWFLGDDK